MAMRRLMALLLVLMLGFTLILSGCSSSPSELTRVRLCESPIRFSMPYSMWPCIKAF